MLGRHTRVQLEMVWQGSKMLGSSSNGLGVFPEVFREPSGTSQMVTLPYAWGIMTVSSRWLCLHGWRIRRLWCPVDQGSFSYQGAWADAVYWEGASGFLINISYVSLRRGFVLRWEIPVRGQGEPVGIIFYCEYEMYVKECNDTHKYSSRNTGETHCM